jgi:FkbM family methyltransferase
LERHVSLWNDAYEADTVQWLRKVINPGDCVFDVGANVGLITLEMTALATKSGRVVAVEPAPGNIELLKKHLDANGVSDMVDIVPAAVGSKAGGTITLNIYGGSSNSIGSGHTIRQHALDHGGKSLSAVQVPLTTIDEICRSRNIIPRVMKIDIEGAELEAVLGAVDTLRDYKPHLIIGFHPFAFDDPVSATKELRALLHSVGYTTAAPRNGSYELREYTFEGR